MSQNVMKSDPDNSDAGPDVAVRLRALREDHPAAIVSTELTNLDDTQAVVRADIALPTGGSASGYGAVPASRPFAIEEAENRALHRALTVLGYAELEHLAPDILSQVIATTVASEPDAAGESSVQKQEEPVSRSEPPALEPEAATDAPVDDEEPPLEDYSWTAFWSWARKHGYQNKTQVEELIEQSITSLSPAQVRNALRAKTGVD